MILNFLFPWNFWVRTVIFSKLSWLVWNLSCVKCRREIIYARERDKSGDPVGGHFTTSHSSSNVYNWLQLIVVACDSNRYFLAYCSTSTIRCIRRDKSEVWIILTRIWTCWNREDNNPLPLTGFNKILNHCRIFKSQSSAFVDRFWRQFTLND